MSAPAAFLDKDGTLVTDLAYNVDPGAIRLARGAAEGVRTLARAGYELVVVTNQSGIARGLFAEEALAAVERRVRELLAEAGVPLRDFVYCPHHPDGVVARYVRRCECRKPAPGMIVDAAARGGFDVARSWMIGDILDDVEAGHRAGCRAALLDNGSETEWRDGPRRRPDVVAGDLATAARRIVALDGSVEAAR